MSRKFRTPDKYKSPYERIGKQMTGMKFQAEQVHDTVQGCGNPECETCLPKSGARGDTRTGSASSNSRPSVQFDDILAFSRALAEISSLSISKADGSQEQRDPAYESAKEKVKAYLLQTSHDVGWDDVIGNEAARTALVEAIEAPIKSREVYAKYGMKPLKGVLLWGPHGCGKTMFGKAAASVIGRLHGKDAMLLKINGPEIQTPYVGQTEQIIRDIFKFARLYAKKHGHPLTIFIDEADAILPARSGRSANWEASNVATFLAEMDGLETSGAFVILATNRPEAIDAALLRDGRCDRKIKVERPSRAAAVHILTAALKGAPLASDAAALAHAAIEQFFDDAQILNTFSGLLNGKEQTMSLCLRHIVNGAMIVGLAQRAKGLAFRREISGGSGDGVSGEDLTQAIADVCRENAGLDHAHAMADFAQEIGERQMKAMAAHKGSMTLQ
jgi:SpoVK/Ycf46/Vps4 family AAA+-type ATPase